MLIRQVFLRLPVKADAVVSYSIFISDGGGRGWGGSVPSLVDDWAAAPSPTLAADISAQQRLFPCLRITRPADLFVWSVANSTNSARTFHWSSALTSWCVQLDLGTSLSQSQYHRHQVLHLKHPEPVYSELFRLLAGFQNQLDSDLSTHTRNLNINKHTWSWYKQTFNEKEQGEQRENDKLKNSKKSVFIFVYILFRMRIYLVQ